MATLDEVKVQARTLTEQEQRELAGTLPAPVGTQLGRLWYLIITVLFVGAVLAGFAAFSLYSGANKDSGAVFLAITTTIVGGLIGLLAPSPAKQN